MRADVETPLREVEAEVLRYSLGELGLLLDGALPPGVIKGQSGMEGIDVRRVALLREHGFQQRLEALPRRREYRIEA